MPKKSDKRIIVLVGFFGLVLVFSASVYFYVIKNDTSQQEAIPDDVIEVTSIETSSIEQIQQEYEDNSEVQFQFLLAEAQKKLFNDDVSAALDYYVAASEVNGISDDRLDDVKTTIYLFAAEINDTDLMDKYSSYSGGM